MSSEKTPNLGLHTWVPEDYVQMEEFNENFKKLDEVGGAADQLSTDVETISIQLEQTVKKEEYTQEMNSVTAQLADIAHNLKTLGLKGDGVSNDTVALINALNSEKIEFFAPKGEYILNNTITVNSSNKKIVKGTEGTVFKINLQTSKTLFDLFSNVEFHNIKFDFSNSYCKSVFTYRPNFGLVKLYNIEIKNIKDMDSTTSSRLIDIPAEGNSLNLEKITFKTIYKLGNGNITDGAGSVNAIIYGGTISTTSAPGGQIKSIYIEQLHNINDAGSIIVEDTSGVYLSLSGKKSNVKISDVDGVEFGKRLLKIQASDVDIDKIKGISETGDSLSVIGTLSEDGFFVSDDIRISNVNAKGNMDYAVAISTSNTTLKDVQIDLYGSNALNNGGTHFGIYLGDNVSNVQISRAKIKAKRPIGLFNVLNIIKNINIADVEINLPSTAGGAISQIHNGDYGFDGLQINKITLIIDATPTSFPSLIVTESTFKGKNKNLFIGGVYIDALDPVSGAYCKSFIGAIRFTNRVSIKDVIYNNVTLNSSVSDLLIIGDSTDVVVENITTSVKCNRAILLQSLNRVKLKEQVLEGDAVTGHIVVSGSTSVEIDSMNEKYKIIYGTQDATEVIRNKGATAQRPKRAFHSFRYFDTTLNKDIIAKTGAVITTEGIVTTQPVWVDAMGNSV